MTLSWNPKVITNKTLHTSFKAHLFLSSSNFLKHIPVQVIDEVNRAITRNHQTTLNTLWHGFKIKSIRAEKHVSDQQFCNHRFRISISLRCFFFGFLPYHWRSWTVYVQQWDWLKGFLLLGTNYDRAWLYDLSLQHPPTLWARSEGSSVSIKDLHCTWGQIHTTTQTIIENIHVCQCSRVHC